MFKLQLYIYCASIWPWFAVNYILYIFVILYKNVTWKSFLKKKENCNIGYVCIPVTLLSLGN